jgi:hypothetical protein
VLGATPSPLVSFITVVRCPSKSRLVVRMREVVEAGVSWTEVARAVAVSTVLRGTEAPSEVDRRRQPAANAIATELATLAL